jgi:hypothetical protein
MPPPWLLGLALLLALRGPGGAVHAPAPPPPRSVTVAGGGLRVSVLSARVLRIETPPFEDRPSVTFTSREVCMYVCMYVVY